MQQQHNTSLGYGQGLVGGGMTQGLAVAGSSHPAALMQGGLGGGMGPGSLSTTASARVNQQQIQ